mgnify:CR=1 FL=1
MANLKLDASPGKKPKGVPADPAGRKAYYEKIMEIYAAQNPVKFQAKKEELEKKAKGFEYIAGKWVNIFNIPAEEVKLTSSQKEQQELERINAVNQDKDKRIADLEARLGAIEKPKGRPKKPNK